jgi:thymidine phosphorylase
VQEALDLLTGEPRLQAVTLALSARLLHLGGLAATLAEAR